jgi:hypothetical protein
LEVLSASTRANDSVCSKGFGGGIKVCQSVSV